MDSPKFVISEAEAAAMAKTSNLSLPNLLPTLVQSALPLSRPPISNYPVAAVGLGASGRIYLGVNLEFPGLPLHHTVHAEQFLLTNLSLNNEPSLTHMAVSSAPCGHCRQFYQELRHAADVKILVTSDDKENEEYMYTKLLDFLPNRFGPHDLLDKNVPLLLEPRDNDLVLLLSSSPNDEYDVRHDRCNGVLEKGMVGFFNELLHAALDAANKSHAPYSACPSGVALVDVEGKVYKGSYTESAAYNPSFSPVQAALVAFVASGGGDYERIIGGVLVEREGAVVKHLDTARLLLPVVAPKCEFRVVHCTKKLD